jgi:sialate O-acetylesterase
MKKYYLLFIALSCLSFSLNSQVILPEIFADNMVLQRNTLIPVWGKSAPGEKIEVKFNKQSKPTKADSKGKWIVKLDPEKAGGPYELVVKGGNTIQLKNVLVGEVWLCSGQSNMEWTVRQSFNSKKETASADYPFIRHIKIPHSISSLPQTEIKTNGWKVCDSTTVGDFTGVGYFFAKNLFAGVVQT